MQKRNNVRFCVLFVLTAFSVCSCSTLSLFELKEDSVETTVGDRQNVKELISELQNRPEFKIEKKSNEEFNGDRYVRSDLEEYIDREWEDGFEALRNININLFTDDIMNRDGLLLNEKKLVQLHNLDLTNESNAISDILHGDKLSFFHISDIQFHDERVYMFSKELTSFFDKFVSSFEHEPNMVLYDYSYYLTIVGTMRILSERLPEKQKLKPSFMIHTGDAIDMGVVSELYEVIYINNKLKLPWFNVLGNHDYQVYGNISSKDVGVINPDMRFQTVNSRYNFINMH